MKKALVSTITIVAIILLGVFSFVERIPEGKVAVVYSPSGGAKEVLNPGWNLIGFGEKTTLYPTRVTIVESKITATTNDGKKVTMPVRYEMKVNKDKVLNIFKELGSQDIEQIQEGYLYNKIFKSAKDVVANYSVLDIYGTKTTEASAKITEQVAKASEDMGFIVTDVTLGSPEVDEVTQKAIDARVQAAQELELKKQQLENEKIEAEKKRVVAEGEAEKLLIAAKAEAEANEIKSKSITPEILKQMEMEARLQHGWITIQGASTVVSNK